MKLGLGLWKLPYRVVKYVTSQKARRRLSREYQMYVNDWSDYEVETFCIVEEIFRRYDLPEAFIIYDIGANDGTWSQVFATLTKSTVYAFEPLPYCVKEIEVRAKKYQTIEIVPIACGEFTGKTTMNVDNFTPSSSLLPMTDLMQKEWSFVGKEQSIEVDVIRLDDWRRSTNAPYPFLIKIDVQGYENAVLNGAQEVLHNAQYVWIEMNFQEFYQQGSTFDSIYTAMRSAGYSLLDLQDLIRSQHTNALLYVDGIFKKD